MFVYLKSGWGEYKKYCVKFPFKNDQFLIFSVFHGVGVTGGGQQLQLQLQQQLLPNFCGRSGLKILNFLSVSRLAQGCRKGDPQTASVVGKKLVYLKSGWDDYKIYCVEFSF